MTRGLLSLQDAVSCFSLYFLFRTFVHEYYIYIIPILPSPTSDSSLSMMSSPIHDFSSLVIIVAARWWWYRPSITALRRHKQADL